MNIDEERKNQESEPIAARAKTQPRRRGPMGRGGMMPGEKAGDFKGSMLKLLEFMGKFKFAPVVGGGITEAEGTVGTPYGVIKAAWKIADGEMMMTVAVPVGTECTVVLPSGEEKVLGSGEYTVTAKA